METKAKAKIIAVDFDGTMCANRWPRIGAENKEVTAYLRKEKEKGSKLILWTCRNNKLLASALKWCAKRDIVFDAVNKNIPETVAFFGSDTRKVYADEYLDDKHNTQFDLPYIPKDPFGMTAWGEKEIEIACKRERGDADEAQWDYGCACYKSALKAFKSLCRDGHSGFSIGITTQILNRLIDGKVLSPIEDVPVNSIFHRALWTETSPRGDAEKAYQCRRMGSLFKYVYPDGTIKYHDVERVECRNVDNLKSRYQSSLADKVVDEIFPITMPYMPSMKPIMVTCEEFLVNEKNGDYDTVGVIEATTPEGETVKIQRYFKEKDNRMVEIKGSEYRIRRAKKLH